MELEKLCFRNIFNFNYNDINNIALDAGTSLQQQAQCNSSMSLVPITIQTSSIYDGIGVTQNASRLEVRDKTIEQAEPPSAPDQPSGHFFPYILYIP